MFKALQTMLRLIQSIKAVTRLSLFAQFALASFVVLVTGMLVIGFWVGKEIEAGVVNRTAAINASYVDGFITPLLRGMGAEFPLSAETVRSLDELLISTALGEEIVSFKVWSPDGQVLYSPAAEVSGRLFPVSAELRRALAGEVVTGISSLRKPENEYERLRWGRLLETYAPLRQGADGPVVAVAEVYQRSDDLTGEVVSAQRRSWLVVGVATVAMYVLLAGIVGRGSRIIRRQHSDLRQTVSEQERLLRVNARLSDRIRRAAQRTTTLNEQFLKRIGSDLHDGPAQDISLALLHLDEATEGLPGEKTAGVRRALDGALRELRSIAAGLRLPELEALTPKELVEQATREHERKTGTRVALQIERLPVAAPESVKIALYRILQEALANSFRHAGGRGQEVRAWQQGRYLCLEVKDRGPGLEQASTDGRLGLAGMRERVELLGGTFAAEGSAGQGTRVFAQLPLGQGEDGGDGREDTGLDRR